MRHALVVAAAVVCIGCSSSSDASSTDGTCPVESCGGPPPSHCADGSTPSLNCVRTSNGTCGWSIDCPQHDAANDADADADQ